MEVKLQLWTDWRDLSPIDLAQALRPIPTVQPNTNPIINGWTADATVPTADSTQYTADRT